MHKNFRLVATIDGLPTGPQPELANRVIAPRNFEKHFESGNNLF